MINPKSLNLKEGRRELFEKRFQEKYKNLNSEQKLAVENIEGPLLILAGPGTGKTELLSVRTANIRKKTDTMPDEILILTFTSNAAQNMRDRLVYLMGADAFKVRVFTFHAFCEDLKNKYHEYFYNDAIRTQVTNTNEIIEHILEYAENQAYSSWNEINGFTYQSKILETIKKVKEYGLNATDYNILVLKSIKEYENINKIFEKFWPDKSNFQKLNEYEIVLREIRFLKSGVSNFVANNLEEVIKKDILENDLKETNRKSTKNIQAFSKEFLKKNEAGKTFLKCLENKEKFLAFAEIYLKYEEALNKNALYDYQDMILEVIKVLKNNKKFLSEVREGFQYVMIDEFQDTNNSQMELIYTIINNEIDPPNICVVGDDDQGIYKFQGADVSNIYNFEKKYKDEIKIISLTKNYRSNENILKFSRHLNLSIEESFEKKYPDSTFINKNLIMSGSKTIPHKDEELLVFESSEIQYEYIARKIKTLIQEGVSLSEIAILAKNRKSLANMVGYLDKNGVTYFYEYEFNILDNEAVSNLLDFVLFLSKYNNQNIENQASLFERFLTSPFIKMSIEDVFCMASLARDKISNNIPTAKLWANIIHNKYAEIEKKIMEFKNLSNKKDILDLFYQLIEDEDFKKEYFSEKILKENEISYFKNLNAIKSLINNLKLFKQKYKNQKVYIDKIVDFKYFLENEEKSLNEEINIMTGDHNIILSTIHKAKGLEWGYVFVLDCDQATWKEKRGINKIELPIHMEDIIRGASFHSDDLIRLIYVAATRAKSLLVISAVANMSEYISGISELCEKITKVEVDNNFRIQSNFTALFKINQKSFNEKQQNILKEKLTRYKLSPTHLFNFINIATGEGPLTFYEKNILKYPVNMDLIEKNEETGEIFFDIDSKTFGTAFHTAIDNMIKVQNKNQKYIFADFKKEFMTSLKLSLGKFNLKELKDLEEFEEKLESLKYYFKQRKDYFKKGDIGEVNFYEREILLDEAKISGKMDALKKINDDSIEIIDFKTGKNFQDFDFTQKDLEKKGGDFGVYDQLKKIQYKDQLLFYKILLDESHDYDNYKNIALVLEFVETSESGRNKNKELNRLYLSDISINEIEEMKSLIKNIYQKIMNTEIVDISRYGNSIADVLQFRKDLINGKI